MHRTVAPTQVTEGVYSRDNHEFSFSSCPDDSTWVTWSAYGPQGSRSFARRVVGNVRGNICPVSDSTASQVSPLLIPGEVPTVAWLQSEDNAYSIWCADCTDGRLSPPRRVYCLPPEAKPAALHATRTETGAVWLTWAQTETGKSTVQLLHIPPHGAVDEFTLTAGACQDYRPQIIPTGSENVYVAWDAYVDGSYDIYGCAAHTDGTEPVEQISRQQDWAVNPSLCRDPEGRLRCVWVNWQDVMWKQSVVHQKFSIRGAWHDGTAWCPWTGNDAAIDIAPLHYGLLTDFDRKPPALGHQGRRLHPMLRTSQDGRTWLFYEAKADDAAQTIGSRGRLVGLCFAREQWSAPMSIAEGLVYYGLPEDDCIGDTLPLVARSIDLEDSDTDADELVLNRVPLTSDLPAVPGDRIDVDLTHWETIELPLPEFAGNTSERTQLPGPAKGRFRLIWGDFHVHGEGSVECDGDLDQIAHYARDKGGLHALTISDNDHFWSPKIRGNQRWLTDFEWDSNLGNAKALNESGVFALFPGYEQTIGADAPGMGRRLLRNHTSVMADDDCMTRDLFHFSPAVMAARREGRRSSCKDVTECVKWAKEKGYYPLPHAHSNWWRLVDPSVQTCCDVMVAWMRNIEVFDIYHSYLNRGMKFGFTGSSDSHYRNPGLGGAVTGLWVTELTRAAVLDALRARRTYATAGQRIVLEFTINETFMGDSLVVSEDPCLHWRVVGREDEEYVLNVLRDGRPMHRERFTGNAEGSLIDADLVIHRPGEHYYYLEVTSPEPIPDYRSNAAHALGGRGWSSPIWLETADWIVA
ncbi:MAG: DUF3604 domain-containing protein [Lentisphaerae bacterium]|jgi:hypothetical protein|nr:DUF3604 domain-containing protein [Lentisphaerota bacterium]MBT5611279.1 DUF3604 domain-containing protein [Lentisphaerota bacterium]MBT7058404.1 DUF3604 domain-containing protein [Lentisphaerota bacterium]MBT7846839.1 DUF3604 domain-containing protein [Lentisphaerota bacterium]